MSFMEKEWEVKAFDILKRIHDQYSSVTLQTDNGKKEGYFSVTELTALDSRTGLMWSRNANLTMEPVSFLAAEQIIKKLNYAGFSDWRLPSIEELKGMARLKNSSTGNLLKRLGINVQTGIYWSGSGEAEGLRGGQYAPESSYVIDMNNGDTIEEFCWEYYYIWPVRDAVSVNLSNEAGISKFYTDELTAIDPSTGLMWCRNANLTGSGLDWSSARDYASKLNYAGFSDWRLPTITELSQFLTKKLPGVCFNTQGFHSIQDKDYWSSSKDVEYDNYVMCFGGDRSCAEYSRHIDSELFLWPVRQSNLPLSSDNDASIVTRYRFTDTTALDTLTGLVWARNANLAQNQLTWEKANEYIKNLTHAGFNDWRLPSTFELEDLIMNTAGIPSEFWNTYGFNSVQPYYYWSSSENTSGVWIVNLFNGETVLDKKMFLNYLWPVRK